MLEKLVRDLGLEDNVKFWGNRAKVGPLLHKFDLFVLTSNWEGLGNVFMEAMASGLPIVATNVGGIPEIVKNGRNGLLVPPGDTEQVRQALTKIITNNSLYEKMSAANFKDAKKRFDPKIAAQKHEYLYKSLLQQN
jgi:L-malate glycosyltransferase